MSLRTVLVLAPTNDFMDQRYLKPIYSEYEGGGGEGKKQESCL